MPSQRQDTETRVWSDHELVAACSSGETWAWDALVERYKRLVYSIPLRAGLAEEDASDVFQGVFTLLLEHLNSIRDPQALGKWLITTAKRESWSLLRKRRREPTDDSVSTMLAEAEERVPDTDSHEETWMDQALVADALGRIGKACQDLLHLLYYDPQEPSYEEIGKRMKMPVGSIGPTRARCLQKMREILFRMGMG